MFGKIQDLHDNFAIIATNSSDFRRVITPSLTHHCQTFLTARQPELWVPIRRHTLIRGGLKQTQEDHLPGNIDSPSQRTHTNNKTIVINAKIGNWARKQFLTCIFSGNLPSYTPFSLYPERNIKACSGTEFMGTNLQCWPLVSEAIQDAAAAAQEVVHASVCVVQVGV